MGGGGDPSKNLVRMRLGQQVIAVEVDQDKFLLGRDEQAEVRVPSAAVSRRHVLIQVTQGKVTVRDLGSANGTFVAGKRIEAGEEVALSGSDEEFALGSAVFISVRPRQAHPVKAEVPVVEVELPSITRGKEPWPGSRKTELSSTSKGVEPSSESGSEEIPSISRGLQPAGSPTLDLTRDQQAAKKIELEIPMTRQGLEPVVLQLKAQADALKSEIWELKTQRVQCERELQTKRAASEEEIARFEAELRAARVSYESDFKDVKVAIERELKQKQESAEVSMAELRAKLAEAQRDCETQKAALTSKLTEAQRGCEAQMAALTSELVPLRKEKSSLDEELRVKRERVPKEIAELEERRRHSEREFLSKIASLETKESKLNLALEASESRREQIEREAERLKEDAERDLESAAERARALRAEAELTQEEVSRTREMIEELREEAAQLQVTVTELRTTRERLGTESARVREELAKLEAELKETREIAARQAEERDLEVRRTRALVETLDAERQVKKLGLEAEIAEIKLREMATRQELQGVLNQRDEAIRVADERRVAATKDVDSASERVGSLRSEATRLEGDIALARAEIARLRDEASRASAESLEIGKARESARAEAERVQAESLAVRAAAETELAENRKAKDLELAESRKTVEWELSEGRKAVERELAESLRLAQATIEKEAAHRRQEMEAEFTQKAAKLERELADAKLSRLREIEKLQEQSEAAERSRRQYMIDEIVRGVTELSRQKPATDSEREVRKLATAVLDGKTVGTLNAEAAQRTRKFWKKVAIWTGAPMAVVLTLILFPGILGWFGTQVNRTIASEKKEGGVFLDEIRRKGMKFQPPMDRNYRDTCADNVLYLEGYVDMKMADDEQKQWIVVLNDFLVGKLGLSDRNIPEIIAAESVMIKDLVTLRQGILPQFKEQGIEHMAEVERQDRAKLIELLQGEDNYRKYRVLERNYYEKYIQEHPSP